MDCDHIREALSARLDGEDPGVDPDLLDRHLGGCAACTDWSQELQVLHRLVRVRPAEEVPDLTAAIVAAAATTLSAAPDAFGVIPAGPAAPGRARGAIRRSAAPSVATTVTPGAALGRARGAVAQPVSATRWALCTVALTQLVLAGPALLLGEDAGAPVHVARELGSFDVALAIGLLVAAWQPARAWGLLPVAGALAFAMGVTAGLDLLEGSVSTLSEAHHLLDLAGVALLWAVAREVRPAPRPASRATRWSAA